MAQIEETLVTVRGGMKDIRDLLQQNKMSDALTRIDELTATLAELGEDENPEVKEARGALMTEEGMLRQRMGDPRTALTRLKDAVALFDELPLDEKEGRYRLQLTTALVNLAVLFARERMHTEALARLSTAAEHLAKLPAQQAAAAKTLEMGVVQNRAAVEMDTRKWAEAAKTLTRSIELGTELLLDGQLQWMNQVFDAVGRNVAVHNQLGTGKQAMEEAESVFRRILEFGEQKIQAGDTTWLGTVVSAAQQLANVLRQLERASEALPFAERAARWAEAALSSNPQVGLRMFVGTQMTLVDINFATDQFAQAETHLFRAVDATEDLQAIILGTGFYVALMRYDDERLAKGDLPRDEVEESLQELIERLKGMNAPAELVEVIEVRSKVVATRTVGPAQALMTKYKDKQIPAQSALAQLLQQLMADLKWVTEQQQASPQA